MASNAASLSARIRRLEAALAKASEIPCGETLSFDPMMRLLGISRPVLRDWANTIPALADSGCLVQGGNGIEWKFEPRSTIMALIRHFGAEREASAAKARAMKEIAGGGALEAVPDEFDIRETREIIRLALEVQDAQERQGRLTDADRTAGAVRLMFSSMQDAALQVVQKMDPLGQWPADIRRSVEDEFRSLMLTQQRAAKEALAAIGRGDLNGGAAQPG